VARPLATSSSLTAADVATFQVVVVSRFMASNEAVSSMVDGEITSRRIQPVGVVT